MADQQSKTPIEAAQCGCGCYIRAVYEQWRAACVATDAMDAPDLAARRLRDDLAAIVGATPRPWRWRAFDPEHCNSGWLQ